MRTESNHARFKGDPVLTSILAKMRTPGEDRSNLQLTEEEWQMLLDADVAHGASLDGTDLWYQSGVVLRMHGAMGQITPVSNLPPGDLVHVCGHGPYHECRRKRPDRSA